MREGTQGPPIVNPLNNVVLKFYDVNHFINFLFVLNTALLIKVVVKTSFKNLRCKILHYYFFLKINHFENGIKTCRLLHRYYIAVLLEYFSTSFIMDFLALNDDVKYIISKHLALYLKIRTLLSKHHDLQKILFGEIVFDDDFC